MKTIAFWDGGSILALSTHSTVLRCDGVIRFEFQPTLGDFLALHRYVWNRGMGRWYGALSVVLVLGYALYPFLSRFSGDHRTMTEIYGETVFLLFIPAWYLFMRVLLLGLIFVKFKMAKWMSTKREYVVDKEGVHIRSEVFSSDMDWEEIRGADCDGRYFFFRSGRKSYFNIPRSCVADERGFMELVGKHVRVSKRWREAGGVANL
jgi:hypothetical protein